MLPKDNELPATTYEAKQLVYPLGLEVQKIHACPTTASSIEASTRIWMHVPYAVHCVIRSEKMILRCRGGASPEESSCEGHVVFAYNTMFEASI